ncbi:MAG TPA: HPr family phosphocarrier protein [Firmicutes bacterium]|nr:HPr family phosphocarrier protein [Bacillota bacterium]
MRELKVKIKTETGLHARPASLLVNAVSKFKSKITIEKDGQEANLQSILGLLSLGVSQNDEIIIKASGKDEDEAIEAVINCGKTYDLW